MPPPLKLLVFGQNGQLAKALSRLCQIQDITAQFIGSSTADLAANPQQAYELITQSSANVVINAAAYTQVDKAETDKAAAQALNHHAPKNMAQACKAQGKGLIHISTDYVFNGQAHAPYELGDATDPINIYGATKLQGELAVKDHGQGVSTCLRTSWVYDGLSPNFLNTMLRLAQNRSDITVVNDQIGRPTYAADLAKACLDIALGRHSGNDIKQIYHVTNSGTPISWADFARAIFKAAHISCRVKDIPSSGYPTPAKRPAYSVMDISDYEAQFGPLPTWQDGLIRALNERKI